MRSFVCALVVMATLGVPVIAQAAPAPHASQVRDGAMWRSLSPAEKPVFLKGVLAGLVTDQMVMTSTGHGLPGSAEFDSLQNFLENHQADLLTYLDKAYANPKEQAGVGALIGNYYFSKDEAAMKRLMDTNRIRMEQLNRLAPQKK
jgi:hypothetical protein